MTEECKWRGVTLLNWIQSLNFLSWPNLQSPRIWLFNAVACILNWCFRPVMGSQQTREANGAFLINVNLVVALWMSFPGCNSKLGCHGTVLNESNLSVDTLITPVVIDWRLPSGYKFWFKGGTKRVRYYNENQDTAERIGFSSCWIISVSCLATCLFLAMSKQPVVSLSSRWTKRQWGPNWAKSKWDLEPVPPELNQILWTANLLGLFKMMIFWSL